MKRKEMVERLKYFFVSEDWCNEADDDFATDIINFLVSQGMLPPAYEKMVSIEKLAPGKELWSNETLFEWEPEEAP